VNITFLLFITQFSSHSFQPFLKYPCRAVCSRNTFGGTRTRGKSWYHRASVLAVDSFFRRAFWQRCGWSVKRKRLKREAL